VEQLGNILGHEGIYLIRLLMAMVLGGGGGLERQARGRPAGLRTNILVCLGSATMIIAFQKLLLECNLGAESIMRFDPARAAAGVITGIGFLGAGTIVKSNDFVRGLTTAASIWVVSALGITIGLGEYSIAITLTVLILVSLYALHRLPINTDKFFSLQLKWHGSLELLDELCTELAREKISIRSRRIMRQPGTGSCQVTLGLSMRHQGYDLPILARLQNDKRFDEVAWY
jgi:putative Mg2+ transporter-C (MgtC) family protein